MVGKAQWLVEKTGSLAQGQLGRIRMSHPQRPPADHQDIPTPEFWPGLERVEAQRLNLVQNTQAALNYESELPAGSSGY